MQINISQLKEVMPQARTTVLVNFMDEFNQQLPDYGIDRPIRVAAFIAQGAYESGELRELVENLYYTSAERLMEVWPTRFRTPEEAKPYLRNPESLANFVYAGRMGNGDSMSGDGYRYRGRGWFNATGKDFYIKMTKLSGVDFVANPDLMSSPYNSVLSACEEWKTLKLNGLADSDDLKGITKLINGGFTGLDARLVYYAKAKKAFGI